MAPSRHSGSGGLRCPVCGHQSSAPFFAFAQLPVFCNVLWPDLSQAKSADRADIQLHFCTTCGFIWNGQFDPTRLCYSKHYENSLHYSARFQEYATALIGRLVDEHDIREVDIVEVGCGKGDFLVELCRRGGNRGRGFDVSFEGRADLDTTGAEVEFYDAFYTTEYAYLPVDVVISRHVLEHIEQPVEFLQHLREIAGERGGVRLFFEVPNGRHTFENLAVWDIIYEHPNYFTLPSLAYTFARAGFAPKAIQAEYGNQFLSILAAINGGSFGMSEYEDELHSLWRVTDEFTVRFHHYRMKWENELRSLRDSGRRAVIWGAGSKGVTFLNMMASSSFIEYAVDLNPRKHGRYIAGSGQKIIDASYLSQYRPDDILIMNPLYESEIRAAAAELNLDATFHLV